jgi:hypothetical protein
MLGTAGSQVFIRGWRTDLGQRTANSCRLVEKTNQKMMYQRGDSPLLLRRLRTTIAAMVSGQFSAVSS